MLSFRRSKGSQSKCHIFGIVVLPVCANGGCPFVELYDGQHPLKDENACVCADLDYTDDESAVSQCGAYCRKCGGCHGFWVYLGNAEGGPPGRCCPKAAWADGTRSLSGGVFYGEDCPRSHGGIRTVLHASFHSWRGTSFYILLGNVCMACETQKPAETTLRARSLGLYISVHAGNT